MYYGSPMDDYMIEDLRQFIKATVHQESSSVVDELNQCINENSRILMRYGDAKITDLKIVVDKYTVTLFEDLQKQKNRLARLEKKNTI
jgi:polyhydroxyalkanoate synthesis regulator phasin